MVEADPGVHIITILWLDVHYPLGRPAPRWRAPLIDIITDWFTLLNTKHINIEKLISSASVIAS